MSNKNALIIVAAVLLVAFLAILGVRFFSGEDNWVCQNGQWIKHGNPSAATPKTGCGEAKTENNADDSSASDLENNPNENPEADGEDDQEANIIVTAPAANQSIGLPLVIKGQARVFENTVSFRIKDSDGKILLENYAIADSPDMGQFGPFNASVNYPEPKGEKGTVEVFEYSARDGSEISKVEIPVVFKKIDSVIVKIFFGNRKEDPDAQNCSQVYSVDRRISKTSAVAAAAMRELLNGTTSEEQDYGYFSEISSDMKLQKITISGGVATADFSQEITNNLDGSSCTTDTIKSQITETLKQFPAVKDVKITVDGEKDIL
jgi:hypothetical protein